MMSYIYEFHTQHENTFTFNHEARGKGNKARVALTKQYVPNALEKYKQDIFKIKKGNMGCLSCTTTANYISVDGFDMTSKPLSNHLNLCLIRMKNNGVKEVALPARAYHPFHPRGAKTHKDAGKALACEYKTSNVIKPEKGLAYFKSLNLVR
jgi:hypothetical protein